MPTRAQVTEARKAAAREALPLRFTADFDYVEPGKTTAYKAGMVLTVPPDHRKAALESKRAVVDGD